MPNPLMRLQRKTSTVDVDRPMAIEPVPERVAGHVFPYRGMETHGVDPNNNWRDPEEYDGYERGIEVDSEPLPQEPDPIPVRVVQDGAREIRRTTNFRAFATGSIKGGGASQVVSARFQSHTRRSAKVKNMDSTTVYIGTSQESASVMNGWPLAQNEVYETTGEDAIWALGTGTIESPLAVQVEWTQVIE